MKRVLLVGLQFPPLVGTSGVQRMLRFAQHLPDFGWEPHVLTVAERALSNVDNSTLSEIPPSVSVTRAFALDASRHLSIRGRYLQLSAIPDRWSSWIPFATWKAVRLIDRLAIDAVWTTYPIASAHVIGAWVHRLRGRPWIADFRDPMAQTGYPEDPRLWSAFSRIEQRAAERASYLTFTAPGARQLYVSRYGQGAEDPRFVLMPNGYDETSFAATPVFAESDSLNARSGRVVLLHSGVVYPSERDPSQLFAALGSLRKKGDVALQGLTLRFRASSQDDLLRALARRNDVADLLELAPPLPYREALAEMSRVHGLLILQAANCNGQIPAKLYEYLRAGRPILGLTAPEGDTAQLLASVGAPDIAALEDREAIEIALKAFIAALRADKAFIAPQNAVARFSRRHLSMQLGALLDDAIEAEKPVSQPPL